MFVLGKWGLAGRFGVGGISSFLSAFVFSVKSARSSSKNAVGLRRVRR